MSNGTAPAPVVVTAELNSRLAVLHTLLAALKPELDALAKKVEEIKDGIKTELRLVAPGAHQIELRTDGVEHPWVLSHTEPVTFDSKRFKEIEPLVWQTYARKGDRWELRQMK